MPHLDGVRGLAILIVTLYRFSKEMPTDTWLGQTLHTLFALGDRGVDLFFVLSGFLITGILLDTKGSPGYFVTFLTRRSLRIFPLYFVAIFLFVVIINRLPGHHGMFELADKHQFFLWTYLANVKMSLEGAWCFGYLDHFWSLSVEEHFYLVWPLILFFCSPGLALRTACLLAGLSCVSRIGFALFSDNGVAPDVLTIFRCDALLLGAILALQIRQPAGLQPLRKWTWPCILPCLAIGIASASLDKRMFTIGHTLWPIMWACVLVRLLTGVQTAWLARGLNLPSLRTLGKYSYAMYVFQSPLIPLLASVLSVSLLGDWVGGNLIAANLLYMASMFAMTYGTALLSWYLLEQHCLKLKGLFADVGQQGHKSRSFDGGGHRVLTDG